MRQQPAAEDVALGIGVGGHGDNPADGLAFGTQGERGGIGHEVTVLCGGCLAGKGVGALRSGRVFLQPVGRWYPSPNEFRHTASPQPQYSAGSAISAAQFRILFA